jgi:hypothetical protein
MRQGPERISPSQPRQPMQPNQTACLHGTSPPGNRGIAAVPRHPARAPFWTPGHWASSASGTASFSIGRLVTVSWNAPDPDSSHDALRT